MKVERVIHQGPYGPSGSHIEPPFDEKWGKETQMAWKAAVCSVDTGLDVTCAPDGGSGRMVRGKFKPTRGLYAINVDHLLSTSGMHPDDAWTYLSGMSTGVQMWKRRVEEGRA